MTNDELDRQVTRLDERRQKPRSRIKFERKSTPDLMAQEFAALKWVVPGYVSEGFVVLAGRQKLGKTWLAIDMALAVATGTTAIGSIDCDQGNVLYIDLENGPRRIQSRVATLFPNERERPDLSKLEWVTKAPQLGDGFLEELEYWRLSVPNPRLVVIDVLQRIKPAGSMARNSYENDYSAWAPVQEWATKHGITVLGLHHTRKGGADDKLEALSGSNGLSACADTTLVLDSDQNGKTLYVRGRDVDEKETALSFAGGFWSIKGDAADVRRSSERNTIIAALVDHGAPMTPKEITDATRMSHGNVRGLLLKMARAGEVHKVGGGRYWTDPMPDNTGNTDNEDRGDVENPKVFEAAPVTGPVIDDNRECEISLVERFPAKVSRRHKCAHCQKRGETLPVVHGHHHVHLHEKCLEPWTEERDAMQRMLEA